METPEEKIKEYQNNIRDCEGTIDRYKERKKRTNRHYDRKIREQKNIIEAQKMNIEREKRKIMKN
ncbi:MAG: hypothetical protein GY870_14490 [archaeon]|nr:hypothetical protein [archaeon]